MSQPRLSPEPIEPVTKTRSIPLPVDAAFELFTVDLGRWWPLGSHSIAGAGAAGVRFEGRVGGRVVELAADGTEHSWADVLAWDPPHRVVLAWHPQVEPVAASILEVRFEPAADGSTLHLEHRGWEELGTEAGRQGRNQYDPGWDAVLSPFLAAADPATVTRPAAG